MERTLAASSSAHVGERVRLAGWLHHQRQLAQVAFLLLRDRSGIAQVVSSTTDDVGRRARDCLAETVIEIDGAVVASEQAPAGVEVRRSEIVVHRRAGGGAAVRAAPAGQLRAAPDAARPRGGVAAASRRAAPSPGWRRRRIGLPRALSTGRLHRDLHAEGGRRRRPRAARTCSRSTGSVARAYLAQSPQFYKQIMVGVFERVYEVGAGLPRRAARHRASPRRVRVARRRDGLHPRPPRRDGGAARRARRHDRRASPSAPPADLATARTSSCPRCRRDPVDRLRRRAAA